MIATQRTVVDFLLVSLVMSLAEILARVTLSILPADTLLREVYVVWDYVLCFNLVSEFILW